MPPDQEVIAGPIPQRPGMISLGFSPPGAGVAAPGPEPGVQMPPATATGTGRAARGPDLSP